MTDNEKLIEEAAKAIFEVGWKTHMTHWHESGHQYAYRERARAALAVFEKAHTPTDDEREARQALDILHRYSFGSNEIGRDQVATLVEVVADALRRPEVPEPSAEDQGPAANCHRCVGAGGHEDEDGNWVECYCQREERQGEPSDAQVAEIEQRVYDQNRGQIAGMAKALVRAGWGAALRAAGEVKPSVGSEPSDTL